jgi:hypothetical protein
MDDVREAMKEKDIREGGVEEFIPLYERRT